MLSALKHPWIATTEDNFLDPEVINPKHGNPLQTRRSDDRTEKIYLVRHE